MMLGIALLLQGIACGGGPPLPPAEVMGPGTYERVMDRWSGGFRRSYRLHVPTSYRGEPLPLVVVLHGGFSSADLLAERSRLDALGDEQGFAVLYPNGTGVFEYVRHWNAGHCCGYAKSRRIDDVAFVADVIDEVLLHLAIDERRIYLVGHSNGGMLAYRFAAERPERVAAMAAASSSIVGSLESDDPEIRMPLLKRPIPLVVFHGREDPRVPYAHVEQTLEWWAGQNVCDPVPEQSELYSGGVLRSRWTGCGQGARIELYTLRGFGHSWPGAHFTDELGDDPLVGFDAAPILWRFFQEYRLDPGARPGEAERSVAGPRARARR
jgi:polyhydroxybutyrate depolymerase